MNSCYCNPAWKHMCSSTENCIYWQCIQPYSSMESVSLESLVNLHNSISTTQLSLNISKEKIVRILHTSFKVAAHRPLSILFQQAALSAAMNANNDFNLISQIYIDNIVNYFQDFQDFHNGALVANIKMEFMTSINYIKNQFDAANLEISPDVQGVEGLESQVLARIVERKRRL